MTADDQTKYEGWPLTYLINDTITAPAEEYIEGTFPARTCTL